MAWSKFMRMLIDFKVEPLHPHLKLQSCSMQIQGGLVALVAQGQ